MSAFGSSSSSGDISGRALSRVKKELEKFNQARESKEAEGIYVFISLIDSLNAFKHITSFRAVVTHVQKPPYRFAY